VGIAGEAGTGKSRLLYEFRRRPWEQPAVCLAGRCLSYGNGVPYLPLLYLLRSRWGIAENDEPAAVTAKVRTGLEKAGMRAEESLPYLLKLLGGEDGAEGLANLSPQALQMRTFAVLRQWLLNVGQSRLVVLEIEDLYWIDETSEDFLSFLVERLPAARLLLLMTYRPGYRPRWIEKSYATQIALRRLTEQEGHRVVDAVLRNAKLPEDLVGTILSKAEGKPALPGEPLPDSGSAGSVALLWRLPRRTCLLLICALHRFPRLRRFRAIRSGRALWRTGRRR
jgi:predicted ATPase